MSIHDMFQKIKGSTGLDSTTAIYFMVIIGVGVSGFGLGRLSMNNSSNMPPKGIAIEERQDSPKAPLNTQTATALKSQGGAGNYMASKNGKLYYTRGCKAANRIKPENEVWFTDASEAESMGYTRSASCK